MKVLVDSCILLDLFLEDQAWKKWSQVTIEHFKNSACELCINPIVYSETSIAFESKEQADEALTMFTCLELSSDICYTAGQIYRDYCFSRRENFAKIKTKSTSKKLIAPDFYIGAHAHCLSIPVITRNSTHFKKYFPGLFNKGLAVVPQSFNPVEFNYPEIKNTPSQYVLKKLGNREIVQLR